MPFTIKLKCQLRMERQGLGGRRWVWRLCVETMGIEQKSSA